MKAVFVALFVLLAGCVSGGSCKSQGMDGAIKHFKHARERLVIVENSGALCSGFMVRPDLAITAGHCIHSASISVNGVQVERLYTNAFRDVAVLKLKEKLKNTLLSKLGNSPLPGNCIFSVGRRELMSTTGVVSIVRFMHPLFLGNGNAGPYLLAQAVAIKGMSGGAVFDSSRRVVGLVTGLVSMGRLTLITGVDEIKKTLNESGMLK